MKDKNLFTVDTDIAVIECDLTNAELFVEQSPDGKFAVEYPAAKNVYIASGDNGIIIRQRKRTLFNKLGQTIKIFVPAHTVPSFSINARACGLYIEKGIYGQLVINADDGKVNLSDCVFESAEITGGGVDAHLYGATVKNNLYLIADKGELLAENTFATRVECRLKRGNIGLVNAACKDSSFDVRKGNITVTLAGAEENFNTSLVTNEGTVNRESAKHDGAAGTFQAHSGKGNIVLDFVKEAIAPLTLSDIPQETDIDEKLSEEVAASSAEEKVI